MRGLAALALVATLVPGCLGLQPDAVAAGPQDPPPVASRPLQGTCLNGLLFQFVDYAATDAYLPPGFHPRDPQGFIAVSPVAFGQAGVLAFMVDCKATDGTLYEAATVALFVESPQVDGVERALFDFYEIERHGDPGEFGGALTASGWPRLAGTVNFTIEPLPGTEDIDVIVDLTDSNGLVMAFGGPVGAPLDLGTGTVRFWRDGPLGLAYYDYTVHLDARVGAGICQARNGSALAAFSPSQVPLGESVRCPPATPVIGIFPDFAFTATARFLPGVHAA